MSVPDRTVAEIVRRIEVVVSRLQVQAGRLTAIVEPLEGRCPREAQVVREAAAELQHAVRALGRATDGVIGDTQPIDVTDLSGRRSE